MMKKFKQAFFPSFAVVAILLTIAFPHVTYSETPAPPQDSKQSYFISLKDFTIEEVKGIGFTTTKDLKIRINAVGGGSKNTWKEIFGGRRKSNDMFAAGWIINADTRDVVWEMSMDNTSGKEEKRTCEADLQLSAGSYEVYYSAHGFASSSSFGNFSSMNIDRRERKSKNRIERFFHWFSDDYDNMYDEFMDRAKNSYGIFLSVSPSDESAIKTFNAPKTPSNTLFAATGVGDGSYIRKKMTVDKDVMISIYALGEGRGRDEVFDYGWITNMDTRERVWEMEYRNTDYAGGSGKNIRYKGDLRLSKGTYELNYVTDDSHSREDWNSKPPYDPFNYGIIIGVKNDADKSSVAISDYSMEKKNIIVRMVRARDNDFLQSGFTLKTETKLQVYAIGEGDYSHGLADYGWIINAKSREKVWEMKRSNTTHAGGAQKNRLADEFITLPAGNYLVFYQTDDSHAYNDWNDDKPYDADSYGITVMGVGEKFSSANVEKYEEGADENVIAQLIRVRDDRHLRQKFSIDRGMKIRVYAIGEGFRNDMADYAWIENVNTKNVVWEMTYRTTTHAGGAEKNRLFDRLIFLEKGEYELNYKTDDSHSFNSWNSDPPSDRTHWGVTLYKTQ